MNEDLRESAEALAVNGRGFTRDGNKSHTYKYNKSWIVQRTVKVDQGRSSIDE